MRGLLAITLAFASNAADAYVGPGLGVGLLGAILGVLAGLFLGAVGVVWYPLKRLLRRRKRPERAARDLPEQSGGARAASQSPQETEA